MLEKVEQGAKLVDNLKKYGLSASQALLVAGAGFAIVRYPDWCKAHWRWLLAGAIAYECLVFILLPIAGFVAELWQQHFKDNALSATASWLKALPAKYSPGFAKRYRNQVKLDHEVFNVRGLGLIGAHTLKLEKVFVDLKISATSNPEKLNPDPVASQERGKAFANARSLWDFLRASKGASADAIALA